MIASAPGRICLFGEHQDYLGLPVIAMAVNLRFNIQFDFTDQTIIEIEKPDLGSAELTRFDPYAEKPAGPDDYSWGIARVLIEDGFKFPRGGRAVFRSGIPLRAGCSSSSAMSAAMMRLLLEIGEHPNKEKYLKNPEVAAYQVYRGEKEKFHGAGGMMDQYSCYLGGLIHVYPDSGSEIPYGVERLPVMLDGIVLIDSGDPKDTQGILGSASDRAKKSVEKAAEDLPGFDLKTSNTDSIVQSLSELNRQKDHWKVSLDHLKNRDLCRRGLSLFRDRTSLNPDQQQELGEMLTEEHRILSQTLGISTSRIDSILKMTIENGALGGKINGSGGGGTCFCYAPDPGIRAKVMRALASEKIRRFEVAMDSGASIQRS